MYMSIPNLMGLMRWEPVLEILYKEEQVAYKNGKEFRKYSIGDEQKNI